MKQKKRRTLQNARSLDLVGAPVRPVYFPARYVQRDALRDAQPVCHEVLHVVDAYLFSVASRADDSNNGIVVGRPRVEVARCAAATCGGGGGLLTDDLLELRVKGSLPRMEALKDVVENHGVTHMAAICAICKSQFSKVMQM